MTLYDLKDLFTDDSQLIKVYDLTSEEIVYEGELAELPYELEDYEVGSIDTVYKIDFDGYITFNIEITEEEE